MLSIVKIAVIILIALSLPKYANSQVTVQGVVISENNEAVPYATVRLKSNEERGTITNLDGYFKINLDSESDTLLISHVGEGTFMNAICQTLELDTFRLSNRGMVLKEIRVTPYSMFNAKDSVTKALKLFDSNHWQDSLQLSAFYREYGAQNDKWGRFFEADLSIQHFGSLFLNDDIKISVNQARKSIDEFENTKSSTNPHFILYRPLKFKFLEQEFEYMGLESYSDKWVYVIRFYNDTKGSEYKGKLYLDSEDLSFIEIHAKLSERGANKVRNKGWGKIDDQIVRYKNYRRKNDIVIKFKDYKNKQILSAIINNGIWTVESKNAKVVYDYSSNFLVTGLKEQFEPLQESATIPKTKDLLSKNYEYDESFWSNYNHLIADKKQREILSHLTPVR
ncbi:carboxypeptidase-like regulatory domain-containing protein [Marivirga salinae]|uniref:Carboxypeptidase-like regulatory domain-containing protein n=1 Tax=Marivirga salinarum TaxID=3059078 RepID=A0AA51REU6_9BACT|nr:carboxypeptidase-like regulatory domain-containing protein [Marivirga sp. BDSF4-3]WMN12225.1 carboxypeptidase-like regulatory domain-containing protein [Marivirga sp. BDSF4-3]